MRKISLITDLGTTDHYNALLKFQILKLSPNVQFVDVSHHVSSHDIQEAAYLLKSIIKHCPTGTVHLVAVYNYYSSNPEYIAFEYEGQYFIGPNNGIFSLVFDHIDDAHVFKIHLESALPKKPFDLYAHAIAVIENNLELNHAGMVIDRFEKKLDIMPVVTNNEIRATIIYIDQFENVILNLTREMFEMYRKDRSYKLFFQHQDPISEIKHFYSDVSIGEVVCFFNESDHLEIAINMGKASSMLDLYKNETVQIRFD